MQTSSERFLDASRASTGPDGARALGETIAALFYAAADLLASPDPEQQRRGRVMAEAAALASTTLAGWRGVVALH
jgi:hypothetical protein